MEVMGTVLVILMVSILVVGGGTKIVFAYRERHQGCSTVELTQLKDAIEVKQKKIEASQEDIKVRQVELYDIALNLWETGKYIPFFDTAISSNLLLIILNKKEGEQYSPFLNRHVTCANGHKYRLHEFRYIGEVANANAPLPAIFATHVSKFGCPECRTSLYKMDRYDQRLMFVVVPHYEHCSQCGGLWLTDETFCPNCNLGIMMNTLGEMDKELSSLKITLAEERKTLQGLEYQIAKRKAQQVKELARRHTQKSARNRAAIIPIIAITSIVSCLLYWGGYMSSRLPIRKSSHGKTVSSLLPPKQLLLPTMVSIHGGTFMMGDVKHAEEVWMTTNEKPIHSARVYRFRISKNVVTVGQYLDYCNDTRTGMPSSPNFNSGWHELAHPIVNVSWNDAMRYCNWLTNKTGQKYDLPTEEEWEYAARGGAKRKVYPWGNDWDGTMCVNSTNSGGGTAAVGSRPPNGYGLNDMAGNVWQWCTDKRIAIYFEGTRVIRGGSWSDPIPACFNCTMRQRSNPTNTASNIGFRVVAR